jgi:capsular polysaccharide transport system permease protein
MKKFAPRSRLWQAAILLCLIATVYWSLMASDRFVSTANVVVQRSDAGTSANADFMSLLINNSAPQDLLLLRKYLLSADMLEKLDRMLHLREHFSDPKRDVLSRLWPANASRERFYDYYGERVSVEYDEYAHVLTIQAQAYTPEMAQKIAQTLVAEGERFMNEMSHRIAAEQVVFIEEQVRLQSKRVNEARQALVSFQNANGLVSARGTVESLSGVVATAEAQLAELNVKRDAIRDVFTAQSPAAQDLDNQIAALRREIAKQRARMASPDGKSLNSVVEEQERLQSAVGFAEDVYKTALSALEKERIEAMRKIKNVAIVQAPTLPEYPMQPRRLYNIAVFWLIAMMVAAVLHLLRAIVRDHRD